ncbi:MDR family MFS transporter [Shouchella clausii]|jgi:MFS transporter, DHA2 family, lincomycin resistance protein|uniref:MFS transporter n=2 Tax=Shouchella clausii TaxID=79880 RepID=A0A268RRU6_SHOCL|nr:MULTISPECIES: MDR family MFS transporter [Shouchella]PAD40645.1 MFS transporter [Bacillus sp. 7520-S]ALA53668.1 drug resistance transporter, EmrB/QacA family [Shouchella clausii]MBU3229760.1 DHA2 family efflux MFS transporter permease subunit [Shouchella clausii]MBU3264156.1 DHA2 family efflux MFS transporter permease subunit [Shouchella clausii]MBU3506661.1 DHA2 family efflux MFS transporter permease subunit [Shouchella clausii]
MAHVSQEPSAAATTETVQVKVLPLLAVLLSGAFVAILSETILNVALNAIMSDFGVASSTAQWLVTGYMLVIGTLIPISAYFMQRFTTRQLFITAMSLFTLGTLIAGFSPVFAMLLVGRLTQAVGTALMIPLLTNVILAVIPIERRGAAMGMVGLVIMFAPAIGPTVSGIIVDSLSWRWLFYFITPISLLSLLFGVKVLRNIGETSRPKLDVVSFILSTLGFGGIVFGFSAAGKGDASFTDPLVYSTLLIGFASLCIFGWRQLKLETPLLDIRVFRYPMFLIGLIVVMLVMMTMFAMMLIMPIYMQGALLFTAVTAGLIMLPGGLLNGALSPVMGRLFDKFGPRPLLIPGTIILAAIVFSYRYTTPGVPVWLVIVQLAILMVAVAMIMMPTNTNGLNQLPARLYPHGTAIMNTLMQVAGAIGAALFISVMENGQQRYLANLGISEPTAEQTVEALIYGSQQSFSTGFFFACAAVVLSFFIKRSKQTQAE